MTRGRDRGGDRDRDAARRSRCTSTSRSASRSARTATSSSTRAPPRAGRRARIDAFLRGARGRDRACAPTRSTRVRPTGSPDGRRSRPSISAAGRRRCCRRRRSPAWLDWSATRFGLADGAEVTLEANPGPDERGDAAALGRRRGDAAVDRRAVARRRRASAARPAPPGRGRRRRGRRGPRGGHRLGQPRPPVRRARTASLATWMTTLDAALDAGAGPPLAVRADPRRSRRGGPDRPRRRPPADDARRPPLARDRARRARTRTAPPPSTTTPSIRLAEAGFRGYEISNWARPGHESRHNLPTGSAGRTRRSGRARTRSTAPPAAGTRPGSTGTSRRSRRPTDRRRRCRRAAPRRSTPIVRRGGAGHPRACGSTPASRCPPPRSRPLADAFGWALAAELLDVDAGRPGRPHDPGPAPLERAVLAASSEAPSTGGSSR